MTDERKDEDGGQGLTSAYKEPEPFRQDVIIPPVSSGPDSADDSGEEGRLAKPLFGGIGTIGEYYFPSDLIGGSCPRVLGEEQSIVWNAAAEASDSERVHVVWNAKDDKIFYLAVRSTELSSHSATWCPFASLLPGMADALPPPVCYTFYSDEAATMMTVTQDSLQIHRGTSSVVRAKAERVSRSLGDAPIVELVPDRIRKLTPVTWYSLSLFEDRARRILAALSVFGALGFAGLALAVWFFAAMSTISSRADMEQIRLRTEQKSVQLLQSAQTMRASPMREQLAKFADLNDNLVSLNAYLEIYQIKANKTLWRAIVPANVTSNRITEIGGQTLDTNAQGAVIGNAREALNLNTGK